MSAILLPTLLPPPADFRAQGSLGDRPPRQDVVSPPLPVRRGSTSKGNSGHKKGVLLVKRKSESLQDGGGEGKRRRSSGGGGNESARVHEESSSLKGTVATLGQGTKVSALSGTGSLVRSAITDAGGGIETTKDTEDTTNGTVKGAVLAGFDEYSDSDSNSDSSDT